MKLGKCWKNQIRVKIIGNGCKRFLNLCIKNQIVIRDLVEKEGYFFFTVSESDWNKAKRWIPKTGIQYEIIEKSGLHTWTNRWRKRKLFFYLPLYACIICYIFSFFLWKIEMIGNFSASSDMILEFLKKEDIFLGCRADKIDTNQLEIDFMKAFPVAQWASFHVTGTTLQIVLKEKDEILSNPLENSNEEQEQVVGLAAGHDGKLVSILTRKGVPLVKEGEEITANQVLIEGKIPIYDPASNACISYQYVEPEGDVLLQYEMPYACEMKKVYIQKEYTGNKKKFYKIQIGNKVFSLFQKKNSFAYYDLLTCGKEYSVFQFLHIPLSVWTCEIREYLPVERVHSEEELKEMLEKEFQKNREALEEKGVQIIEKNVTIKGTVNTMGLYGVVSVLDKNLNRIPIE